MTTTTASTQGTSSSGTAYQILRLGFAVAPILALVRQAGSAAFRVAVIDDVAVLLAAADDDFLLSAVKEADFQVHLAVTVVPEQFVVQIEQLALDLPMGRPAFGVAHRRGADRLPHHSVHRPVPLAPPGLEDRRIGAMEAEALFRQQKRFANRKKHRLGQAQAERAEMRDDRAAFRAAREPAMFALRQGGLVATVGRIRRRNGCRALGKRAPRFGQMASGATEQRPVWRRDGGKPLETEGNARRQPFVGRAGIVSHEAAHRGQQLVQRLEGIEFVYVVQHRHFRSPGDSKKTLDKS